MGKTKNKNKRKRKTHLGCRPSFRPIWPTLPHGLSRAPAISLTRGTRCPVSYHVRGSPHRVAGHWRVTWFVSHFPLLRATKPVSTSCARFRRSVRDRWGQVVRSIALTPTDFAQRPPISPANLPRQNLTPRTTLRCTKASVVDSFHSSPFSPAPPSASSREFRSPKPPPLPVPSRRRHLGQSAPPEPRKGVKGLRLALLVLAGDRTPRLINCAVSISSSESHDHRESTSRRELCACDP